jgi:hypothetical protein
LVKTDRCVKFLHERVSFAGEPSAPKFVAHGYLLLGLRSFIIGHWCDANSQ